MSQVVLHVLVQHQRLPGGRTGFPNGRRRPIGSGDGCKWAGDVVIYPAADLAILQHAPVVTLDVGRVDLRVDGPANGQAAWLYWSAQQPLPTIRVSVSPGARSALTARTSPWLPTLSQVWWAPVGGVSGLT